jgi:homoserine/homoserine lactone efflux protein
MSLHVWALYAVTVLLYSALPGPGAMLVMSHGLAHGARPAIATVCGIEAGIIAFVAVTALGLGTLLTLSAGVFDLIRWAGAAYLVFLGVRKWLERPVLARPVITGRTVRRAHLGAQGMMVSLSNPKSLLFFGALFPQFVNPASAYAAQMFILGITTVAIDFCVLSSYAALPDRIGAWLRRGSHLKLYNRTVGTVLIAAGIAVARQGSL